MNPPTNQTTGQQPVQDIKPPAGGTEVVNNIPVQNPVSQVYNPAAEPAQPAAGQDMDHVLKDVNASVKQAENPAGKKKPPAVKAPGGSSAPVLATAAACLAAAALIAAAVMAYK
ncbi:MAG TPA: hypothetical protein VFW52_03365 [Candidatus Saccharimonadales bacterium]|nr:hypothetical protein [Candidatus Saccharimonadales bacterium]